VVDDTCDSCSVTGSRKVSCAPLRMRPNVPLRYCGAALMTSISYDLMTECIPTLSKAWNLTMNVQWVGCRQMPCSGRGVQVKVRFRSRPCSDAGSSFPSPYPREFWYGPSVHHTRARIGSPLPGHSPFILSSGVHFVPAVV
jgi:hypothetical protein